MNKIASIKLPILVMAMAFILSCSSNDDNGGDGSSSSGVGNSSSGGNLGGSSSSGVGNSSSSGNLGGSSSSGVGNSSSSGNLGDTFKDPRDNTTYKTIKIGTQTWMAENLNYDVPSNDTDVCYDNDPANCTTYGRLYDWATAMTACPSGWHLPSNEDWDVLVFYYTGGSSLDAGTELKATSGWNTGSGYKAGTNEHGFSALPGGYGNPVGDFSNVGDKGYWWSASDNDDGDAYGRDIYYDSESVYYSLGDKGFLYSVRCVELPPPCDHPPLLTNCLPPITFNSQSIPAE